MKLIYSSKIKFININEHLPEIEGYVIGVREYKDKNYLVFGSFSVAKVFLSRYNG